MYKYLHIEDVGIVNPENRFSFFVDADIDKYTNNYKYNFLYSFINTNFFNGENKIYLGFVFGQIVSSYSIISIFKSSEKIFKDNALPKICLVILAIHPILVLYSLKFSTDNFMILGLSCFLRLRVLDINNHERNNYFKIKLMIFLLFVICLLINPKLIILFFTECSIILFKQLNKIKLILQSKYRFVFLLSLIFTFFIIAKLTLYLSNPYIDSVAFNLWDGKFPLKPADINNYFCDQINCYNSLIFSKLINIFSWMLYIPPALIFLTGARARFADLPWELSLGGFDISYLKNINNGENLNLIENFDQSGFLILVLLPMIVFSTFHLIGLFNYLKRIKENRLAIYIAPISLSLIPILFYPYMRYFIPLIPISCIGAGLIFSNIFNRNSKNII